MKEIAKRLREAIALRNSAQAESALSEGLAANPDRFVEVIREKGVLRYARYDFEFKLLRPLTESILSQHTSHLTARSKTYLGSVLALGVLVPEVRSAFRAVQRSINPRSFKTYLVTIDALYREEHLSRAYYSGLDRVYSSWDSFSKEELAEAFSYYYSLLLKNETPKVPDLNYLVAEKVQTSFYRERLAELAKIIRFREAEILIECYPFRAVVRGSTAIVEPECDDFEKSVRLGYIRDEQQRDADRRNFDPRRSREPDGRSPEFGSMREAAAVFVNSVGDRFFELIEEPVARFRLHFPLAAEFTKFFSQESALLEEYLLILDAMKSLFIDFEQLRSIRVHKSITLHDIVRFQRLAMFMCLALQEHCKRRGLLQKIVYYRSLVPHFTRETAHLLAKLCGIQSPDELFELLCPKQDGTGVMDFVYTPVLRMGATYLVPLGVVAHSSIIRNALQVARFRFDSTDDVDPVGNNLVSAFQKVGVKAIPRTEFRYGGRHGEIDVMAVIDNHLFAFECKNSLHPCNVHELRQSYDHLLKGFSQLTAFREFAQDSEFLRLIGHKTGLQLTNLAGMTTCVVTGNRMFNGYSESEHSVRNIHELINVILGGDSEFGLAVDLTRPDGEMEMFSWKHWQSDVLKADDLIGFIRGDRFHQAALSAMSEYHQIIQFGRTELRFRSFFLDFRQFVERLRLDQRVQVRLTTGR